jgi:hypothetical protein
MSAAELGWSQRKKFFNKESALFTFPHEIQFHIKAKDVVGFGVI